MNIKKLYILLVVIVAQVAHSQETLPVYSDYLSDNYYLLHPSMAGAASCDKVRLTARQQWFGQADAPALQTLSYNARMDDANGAGIILFNDKNGYHSQSGFKVSYAHHLLFSRDEEDLNKLSFGINVGYSQSLLDETSFLKNFPNGSDPTINGTIVQKANYLNIDIGASYAIMDFYVHFTYKNILDADRKIYTPIETRDLKRMILNTGYTFGDSETIMWEPSVMFQYITQSKEKTIDLNLKLYKALDFGKVWGGVSYRRGIDGAQYVNGTSVSTQKLQYITPILGVNYKQFMVAYTYSYLAGNVNFDTGGFHQITLGINLFCTPEKYHCNCPANN
jgi:type IX secretion system PorP/SprF family membrane protein